MNNEFFCVGCGEMIAATPTSMVFKTGFFRNKHSLGCCEACLKPNSSQPAETVQEEKDAECAAQLHPPVAEITVPQTEYIHAIA